MKIMMVAFCVAILTVFVSKSVYPCSCIFSEGIRKDYRKASAVFVGEVIEMEDSGNKDYPVKVTLRIERYWKGIKKPEFMVITDLGLNSCNMILYDVGKKYLVYVYGKEHWTNGCTRTRKLEEAEEDLQELGKAKMFGLSTNIPLMPSHNKSLHLTARQFASHRSCSAADKRTFMERQSY